MNIGAEQLSHMGVEEQNQNNYDEIGILFLEHVSNIFKTHYAFFWGSVGILIAVIHTFIIFEYEGKSLDILLPSITFGLIPCATIISTIYFSKLLEKFTPSLFIILSWDHEETKKWYYNEIRDIFSDKRMLISGILMSIIFTPSIAYLDPLELENAIAKISFAITISAATFIAGGLLYSLSRIVIMLDRLGKTDAVQVSIYQHPITGIKAIGVLMMKISLTVLFLYLIGISYIIFCKPAFWTIFTTIIFGMIVFCLFTIPQIKIHKIMAKVKHEKLINFSEHLEKTLHDVTVTPSEKNISQVRELFAIQKSLSDMNEWPFDTKMFLSILTGIAIPIILLSIQVLCKKGL